MIIFSHPTVNANVRHAASALAGAGLLEEFWTTIAWSPSSSLAPLIPARLRTPLARRALPAELARHARFMPFREFGRHACGRVGLSWLARHEKGCFSIDAVYRALDRKAASRVAANPRISAVYAYEDGAAAAFHAAKDRALYCFYDLPIGYWRAAHAIYAEEKEREPQWASTLSGMLDSAEKCARKDDELRLADLVLVASTFTKKTLELVPGARSAVIPYGAPPPAPPIPRPRRSGDRLKVLFVGALGQRKGLSYLLKALDIAGTHFDLTLIGRPAGDACAPLDSARKSHRWIPSLPHAGILREMSAHDVMVFPSLFEGFGLVILEAMSQGLPVITTPHTAGPDLIEDGKDGFIVPIRSAESIARRLDQLASDPALLAAMSDAARETAASLAWRHYHEALVSVIGQHLAHPTAAPAAVTS